MSKTITVNHETGTAIVSRNTIIAMDHDADIQVLYLYPGIGMRAVIEINGVCIEEAQRVRAEYERGFEEDMASMYGWTGQAQ